MKYSIIIFLVFSLQISSAQVFEIDTIQWSGPSENRINLVILPDGYQSNELNQFINDAVNFSEILFTASPYKEYKAFFNVIAIQVPSNESGASHPGTATGENDPFHPISMVDNYFGSTFDLGNIHRLLGPTKFSALNTVLANNFPTYDQVLILVNSPHYGGSGGTYATTSLDSRSSAIAIHELGHSFASLKDEYYAGDNYAAEDLNMTKDVDPENIRWKNWLDIDDIGIYQHCCTGNSSEWYRPHQNCKMRRLSAPFCSVCKQATIERIHSLVDFIDSYSPDNVSSLDFESPMTFSTQMVEPEPNSLNTEWILNGVVLEDDAAALSIEENDLIPGNNQLQVIVRDTTTLLKVDNHHSFHYSTIVWNIKASTVSTNKISSNALRLKLYPNPNQDVLYFDFAKQIEDDYQVIISDVSGNQIIIKEINHLNQKPKIILGQLPAGTYLVNFILNNGSIISRKIIKQ